MTLVIDASVALKWFLGADDEPDTQVAPRLLHCYVDGKTSLAAPVHFHAEVASVLARKLPDSMHARANDLRALSIPVRDDPLVLARAMELARELDHHLFDTLYHAVALAEKDGVLVTADYTYLVLRRRARLGVSSSLLTGLRNERTRMPSDQKNA